MDFEFVFNGSTKITVDPNEYKGMTIPKITEELKRLLQSIAPHVSYYEDDLILAADEIARG
jgi:hypothetical protein